VDAAEQAPSDTGGPALKVHVAPLEGDHLADTTAGVCQEQDERVVRRLPKSSDIEKMLKLPDREHLVRGHPIRPDPSSTTCATL
jgi:hypothetical protein